MTVFFISVIPLDCPLKAADALFLLLLINERGIKGRAIIIFTNQQDARNEIWISSVI
jgi:hypothetical protein